jgi:ethanolaminephosphotransferase
MGYIPAEGLANLKKYAYSGVDKSDTVIPLAVSFALIPSDRSLVSRYVLNPFWTWFVTLWPTSVAPNTVGEVAFDRSTDPESLCRLHYLVSA